MKKEEIGAFFKFRREFIKLKQEDLAAMSGVTSRTIHNIESGEGNPSISTLEKLAEVLDLELVVKVKDVN